MIHKITLKTFNKVFILVTAITMLSKMVACRIEAEQYEQINKIAEEYQVSTAVVARWAITAYLKQDHARQTV